MRFNRDLDAFVLVCSCGKKYIKEYSGHTHIHTRAHARKRTQLFENKVKIIKYLPIIKLVSIHCAILSSTCKTISTNWGCRKKGIIINSTWLVNEWDRSMYACVWKECEIVKEYYPPERNLLQVDRSRVYISMCKIFQVCFFVVCTRSV